jgi:hypothetical protein
LSLATRTSRACPGRPRTARAAGPGSMCVEGVRPPLPGPAEIERMPGGRRPPRTFRGAAERQRTFVARRIRCKSSAGPRLCYGDCSSRGYGIRGGPKTLNLDPLPSAPRDCPARAALVFQCGYHRRPGCSGCSRYNSVTLPATREATLGPSAPRLCPAEHLYLSHLW